MNKCQNVLKILLLMLVLQLKQQCFGQMIFSYGMRRLALSLNQFGLDMLRTIDEMQSSNSNETSTRFAFCPFCIGSSLAMLMAGLEVSSRNFPESLNSDSLYESLRYALYVNSMQQEEINLAFLDLMRHLQVNLPDIQRMKESDWNESMKNHLTIINQIYVQRYLPMDYRFYGLVHQYYHTPIRTLDFAYASEESFQHINAMVEYATNHKIKNIVNAFGTKNSTMDQDLSLTRLIFLSGLYIKGNLDFRSMVMSNHHNPKTIYRRGAFQRLWPLRSPLFQLQQPFSHGFPPPNYQPLPLFHQRLPFKPWLMNQTSSTQLPLTTINISATLPTTTIIDLNQTTTASPPTIVQPIFSNTSLKINTFNPFKPFKSPPSTDSEWILSNKKSIRLRYQHNSYLNCTVIEMPFVSGLISMLILLPDNQDSSMHLILSRLNAQLIIDLLQDLEIKRFHITFPLMNITYSMPNFRQVFTKMGLTKILDQNGTESIASIKTFPLSHMHIIHKSVLDIGVIDNESHYHQNFKKINNSENKNEVTEKNDHHSKESSKEHDLKVDKITRIRLEEKTFIYLIIDNISGLVLTMGKY